MKAETLRKSILQYAIQGKLVPQIDTEEPASELLKKIKAEKDELIQQGKIKEPKALPVIGEGEKAFEIPDSWEWVRLGRCLDVRDGTHDSPKYVTQGYPFVTSKNLVNGRLDITKVSYISKEDYEKFNGRSNVDNGDILYAMIGSIGNPVIVNKTFEFAIKNVALFKFFNMSLKNKYVYYFLSIGQDEMISQSSGGVQKFVSLNFLRNFLIPIPPLEEQKRIVARIEELMLLVDEYEKKQIELEKLEKEFPEKLKKSVLQYAIQGKLVPQIDTEESASELLKKIKSEKDELIQQKKIKEPKPLPAITEDEKPFEIPDSWEWVRLETLCKKIGSGSTPNGGKRVYVKSGIKFLREQNVQNYGLKLDNVVFITEEMNRKKLGSVVNALDLLLNITGASIGRCALVPTSFDIGNINQHILILRLIDKGICDFVLSCIHSPYTQDLIMEKQVGAKEGLSATKAKNFPIPLPPLEEQKRIVSRVKELFKLVDLLSSGGKLKMVATQDKKD